MTIEAILALLRHGLTVAGGYLVAQDLTTNDEITSAAGWIVGLLGMAWSIYRKVNNAPRAT